jgi:hypothetical protein
MSFPLLSLSVVILSTVLIINLRDFRQVAFSRLPWDAGQRSRDGKMPFLLATTALLFRSASCGCSIPRGTAHSLPSLQGQKCQGNPWLWGTETILCPAPLCPSKTGTFRQKPQHQINFADFTWHFYGEETTGKMARTDVKVAGKSMEMSDG